MIRVASLPIIQYVFSMRHGPKVCAKRTGARLARAGRGMQPCRSGTRAARQAFERTHMHASIWRKQTLDDGYKMIPKQSVRMRSKDCRARVTPVASPWWAHVTCVPRLRGSASPFRTCCCHRNQKPEEIISRRVMRSGSEHISVCARGRTIGDQK
jgi:hypothetical protein